MAVDLSRYYTWKEQQRAEGRAEGHAEGRAEGAFAALVTLFERRMQRALDASERDHLRAKFESLGADRLGDALLGLDAHALAAWIAAPATH